MTEPLTSLMFFDRLVWIDNTPLLATIEPYRRDIFTKALDTLGPDGFPLYNMVVAGRGKKNFKSADLILASLYKLVISESHQGNDCFVVGNDEGQAADDLSLAKKLVEINPNLKADLEIFQKEIRRRDGRGVLKILPAQNVIGQHGKTACFVGYDEIHGQRDYDLLEALAPDPTRRDALQWITSYDTIYNVAGIPLHDLKEVGFAGTDPRLLFSWYSGDRCTDPDFAGLPPEQRANPSMASWANGAEYLEQQRRRLPTHKFRRLHLNLPGAPNGAFLDQGKVMEAIAPGSRARQYLSGISYFAFVDMAGGSGDDACLAIAHVEDGVFVLDLVVKQDGSAPFNPRNAVYKFCRILLEWGISSVVGDSYAGSTFACDFEERDITYVKSQHDKTEIYERFEPRLNAGEVRLYDEPMLVQQLLTLVVRGAKIDHEPGGHDDFSNAACGAINLAAGEGSNRVVWSFVSVPWGDRPAVGIENNTASLM